MVRWEPDARGRLTQAALDLFSEQGFEATTVAEIAARAGLTERTFFRYFADKREVLFAGGGELERRIVEAVAGAPASSSPLEAVTAGLEVAADVIPDPHFAARRQAVIAANPDLQERELIKLASLATAVGEALVRSGVSEAEAALAAEAGVAIFRIAFARWVEAGQQRSLRELIREAAAQLRTLAAGANPPSVPSASTQ